MNVNGSLDKVYRSNGGHVSNVASASSAVSSSIVNVVKEVGEIASTITSVVNDLEKLASEIKKVIDELNSSDGSSAHLSNNLPKLTDDVVKLSTSGNEIKSRARDAIRTELVAKYGDNAHEVYAALDSEATKKVISPLMQGVDFSSEKEQSEYADAVKAKVESFQENQFLANFSVNGNNDGLVDFGGGDSFLSQIKYLKDSGNIYVASMLVMLTNADRIQESQYGILQQIAENADIQKSLQKIMAACQTLNNFLPYSYKDASGKTVTIDTLYDLYAYAFGGNNPHTDVQSALSPFIDLLKQLPGGNIFMNDPNAKNGLIDQTSFNSLVSELSDQFAKLNTKAGVGGTSFLSQQNDTAGNPDYSLKSLSTAITSAQTALAAAGNVNQQLTVKQQTGTTNLNSNMQMTMAMLQAMKDVLQTVTRLQ